MQYNNLFTIAIPTYNNGKTLKRAIESAIQQDYKYEYEVLVIDNNSSDKTTTILEKYSSQVKIIRNPETVSQFENHNLCFQNAKGIYVLFCHSDDWLSREALTILLVNLRKRNFPQKYVMWGYSLYGDFSKNSKSCGIYPGSIFAGVGAVGPFLAGGLSPSGTCYHNAYFKDGGFLISTRPKSPMDSTSMIMAVFQGYRFEMIQEIYLTRIGATISGGSINLSSRKKDIDDAYKPLMEKLSSDNVHAILLESLHLKESPLICYLALSKYYRLSIAKVLLKSVIKHPKYLISKYLWAIVFRILKFS